MAADPKYARVSVTLKNDDPIDFTINSSDLNKDSEGNLIFKNEDWQPGFRIHFELDDQTGKGYLFPKQSDKHEGAWSKVGSKCPDSKCDDVFKVIDIPPHRQTMVVHNPNPNPPQGRFQYTLRVTKDGGAHYLPLDPGGVNQNGGVRKNTSAAVFVVGAIVGAIVALGAERLF